MNIFSAVREGQEKTVSSLISADPTLLEKAEEGGGDTPLMLAVEHGKTAMVKLLLKEGADIDNGGHKGETALMRAITKGNEELVSLLLGHGARVDLTDDAGKTPLMRASIQGHLGLVRLVFEAMLERGKVKTGVDRSSKDGKTALHHAAAGGHFEVVAYLLCNEAQASIKDASGNTPLMLACEKGPVEAVQLLLLLGAKKGQGLEERDRNGETALHHAAEGGHKRVVSLLLRNGAKASKKDRWSTTPLMLACKKGPLEAVEMLVEARKGLGLDEKCDQGRTALQYAVYGGHKDIVAFLLSKGAQANTSDGDSFTPFMYACLHGHLDMVQILHGAAEGQGLEARDSEGQTALHDAALGGHKEVAAFLLSQGADASSRDDEDATPVMLACEEGHLEVVQMLLEATEGQGLEDRDRNGWTALHLAAAAGHKDVVAFLLSKGADATTKGAMQETPLMKACAWGKGGVVQLLLKHTRGQGLSERNSEGKTVLHVAASGWVSSNEVVKVLLLAGADPSITDTQGRTPPQAAEQEERHRACVETFEVSCSVQQYSLALLSM
jgi:serine/threonine-protein phosphatase 6 regulatory ankyrin repeat subunit A/serine/threonine-protein phosphatase 6 regulatory ankyrin repeat subunit B